MFERFGLKAPMAAIKTKVLRMLPTPVASGLRRLKQPKLNPKLGEVDMGDFARTTPISPVFGFDRGTPIDRYYIEDFLAQHAGDITGHALEVGDAAYCERYGSGITRQDVLHVSEGVPGVTMVGDLSVRGTLGAGGFDCIVLTQTLHLIYDMPAAVAELKRGLRIGGTALVTVPGITPIYQDEHQESWFWSLTQYSALRLFGDVFGQENVEVEVYGNALAATAFIQGLAVEECGDLLDPRDPKFPVTVAIRARRAE